MQRARRLKMRGKPFRLRAERLNHRSELADPLLQAEVTDLHARTDAFQIVRIDRAIVAVADRDGGK